MKGMMMSDAWRSEVQLAGLAVQEHLWQVPRGAMAWQTPMNCVLAFGNDGLAKYHLGYLRAKAAEAGARIMAEHVDDKESSFTAFFLSADVNRISDWLWESWAINNGQTLPCERDPARDVAERRIAGFGTPMEEAQ